MRFANTSVCTYIIQYFITGDAGRGCFYVRCNQHDHAYTRRFSNVSPIFHLVAKLDNFLLFKIKTLIISHEDTIKSSVWTSGSYEGVACDLKNKFAWCPSGRLLNASQISDARFWVTPPDGSVSTQRCLELKYDAAAAGVKLSSAHCSADKKAMVCQVNRYCINKIMLAQFSTQSLIVP
jgi:hypothetical protein